VTFRYFYLFFRAEAFTPLAQAPEAGCFLDQLRRGSQEFAKEIGDRLRDRIFAEVFPYLAQGFVDYRKHAFQASTRAGDSFLSDVYDATLTLLYRLLFLLYAEALDLVPLHEPAYSAISLSRIKQEIKEAAGHDADATEEQLKKHYDRTGTELFERLQDLFTVIDGGSSEHNVPAYNGGLFRTEPDAEDRSREAAAVRFLARHRVPDFYLARAIDLLARDEDSKSHELVFVDYKALGVRQLGSIYEGLLMYQVVVPRDDWERGYRREGLKVALVPSNKERKSSGSYFTPQHIVKYIVANTVGPLLDEKLAAAAPKLRDAQRDYHETRQFEHNRAKKMPVPPRSDAAIAHTIMLKHENTVWDLFDLKVLDPAMGSGHFLVEAVDCITDRVLDFLAGFPWNPVQVLVDQRIRRQILEALERQEVKINEERLTDVNLIKRLVMKRCVYGVDLNPMAVELAKVSLWLDCFTLGAPLSFLDHHLKCGNSLIGATIEDLKKASQGWMYGIPMEPLERATRNMEMIADLADATLTEVARSAETYRQVLAGVRGYRALLDCLVAESFGVEDASNLVKHGQLDLERWEQAQKTLSHAERQALDEAEHLNEERNFLHWDIDFPDVFYTPRRSKELRSFDTVIGNPPWGADLEEADLRFLRHQFCWCEGQRDTYMEMTEQAHKLLRTGGRDGMVLPDAWLTGTKYTPFRRAVLATASPTSVVDLPYNTFPEAYVDCAILTTVREESDAPRPSRSVNVVRFANDAKVPQDIRCWPQSSVALSDWRDAPACVFALLDEMEATVIARFTRAKYHFSDIVEIDRGLEAYGQKTPSEIRRTRGYHSDQPLGEGWCPQLSGELRRYQLVPEFSSYVNVKGDLAECPPEGFFEGDRVLIRRMVSRQYRLMASGTARTFAVDSSTLIAKPRDSSFKCGAVLALANSAFLSFCQITKSNIAQRDDYPKVSLYEARSWPLPPFQFLLDHSEDPSGRNSVAPLPKARARFNLNGASRPAITQFMTTAKSLRADGNAFWSNDTYHLLASLADGVSLSGEVVVEEQTGFRQKLARIAGCQNLESWSGKTSLDDLDYLGWDARYPAWQPDAGSVAEGRWFPNGVAPPLAGTGPGDIPWDLIARVYPSYPLPGIDAAAWEAAAWDELCDLLRKNKTKIGHARVRADLTGSGAVRDPTGPLRQLQAIFLDYHRKVRANRARAAELDFLIDRIVFRLFELTLEEQKLILARVGPGRPLPPRRRRRGGGR
jgi:type I restriction-modification system DNA methylase subunit